MSHTILTTDLATQSPLYSQGVRAGSFVYVSGCTGVDVATGGMTGPTIQEQTAQAIRNGAAILAAGGAGLADVIQVTVLLARPEDFAGMNEAYGLAFPQDPPARAVARFGPEIDGVLVSIVMTAYLGD